MAYSYALRIKKDTWGPYPGTITDQARVTHGTFFHIAREEGLLSNTSIHAGIRCKLSVSISNDSLFELIGSRVDINNTYQGLDDIEHDESVGFELISTDDIDDIGIPAIIAQIRQRVGKSPVYLRYCTNPFSTPCSGIQ